MSHTCTMNTREHMIPFLFPWRVPLATSAQTYGKPNRQHTTETTTNGKKKKIPLNCISSSFVSQSESHLSHSVCAMPFLSWAIVANIRSLIFLVDTFAPLLLGCNDHKFHNYCFCCGNYVVYLSCVHKDDIQEVIAESKLLAQRI